MLLLGVLLDFDLLHLLAERSTVARAVLAYGEATMSAVCSSRGLFCAFRYRWRSRCSHVDYGAHPAEDEEVIPVMPTFLVLFVMVPIDVVWQRL